MLHVGHSAHCICAKVIVLRAQEEKRHEAWAALQNAANFSKQTAQTAACELSELQQRLLDIQVCLWTVCIYTP